MQHEAENLFITKFTESYISENVSLEVSKIGEIRMSDWLKSGKA